MRTHGMVDKQTIDLGVVLKSFPKFRFSMDTTEDRLRLQRFIYLLQSFDVFLGYVYSWYIRGPYCSTLNTCGFALNDIFHRIPEDQEVRFADYCVMKRFKKFRKFIRGHEDDGDWLEMAAKAHLLTRLGEPRAEAIRHVAANGDGFTEKMVERAVGRMRRHGIMAAWGPGTEIPD